MSAADPFLFTRPLLLCGRVVSLLAAAAQDPDRFLRIADNHVALNDWDAWDGRVQIFRFARTPFPHALYITRGVDGEQQPYTVVGLSSPPDYGLRMQVWDHRPNRLYTTMQMPRGSLYAPFQILDMDGASTARFQRFTLDLAAHTERTDLYAALSTLWSRPNVHP